MPPGSLGSNLDHSWPLWERLPTSHSPPACPGPSEGPTNPPDPLRGPPDPSRPSRWASQCFLRASRPLPDLYKDLSTHSDPPRRPPNFSCPILKGLSAFPGHPVGPPILSLPSLSLPSLRKGLLTPPSPPGGTPNLSRPTQPLCALRK